MSFTPPVGAATSSARGIVKLAGDLGGTADSPTVANMARASLGGQETVSSVTSTTTTTLNLSNGNVFIITLAVATTTFVFSGAVAGKACSFAAYLKQDANGNRAVNWPSNTGTSDVLWAGGVAPTLSTTANAVDVVVFETLDGGTNWYGSLVGAAFA